jgi:transcriptional regulator GlxA family with amidase domain
MDRREFPSCVVTTGFSTHTHTLRILHRILGVGPSEYRRDISHFSAS